tara:strand:+ start:181 stop:408 length:228 start_codon:yes stop_codon:yes gene_type:complete
MLASTNIKYQSKKMSLVESFVNVLIGYIVAVIANLAVLPLFGYNVTFTDGSLIGLAFTIISLIRTYIIRRIFNYR